ncbi:MAG: nuclear transport factor 2 family protein [Rhodospirillales bacterium]|jgi:hypothetical protein|nr:nuclear transport factor 2 family protein [Rhodospirillales bacterium]MBT4041186.1 nuclear transport factor 2 family protein [Rhodospirillales bacterium]MBT4625109.1 nuclear transport factor 2 family protein [Rhodospirillales bacterium]MBT5353313.1 nuclear transport factor 2 family protein [Rhodospirillales bacterium]MBT5520172.1 nuclear transport factor 2 family protein [Rhodospirillales bacterium]
MTDNAPITMDQLLALLDAFNNHDLDTIVDGFTDDGLFILASGADGEGTRFQGKEDIREALEGRFAAVPDICWSEGKHWIMDNKALSEWRVTGTLPNGDALDCLGCDLWEFEGGKVSKKDTYYKQVIS